ncbi:hypothetical protein [Streptomyces fulvoviolaceus]|uniref:hypothetical protein n=1 Tax=Streptomyces fulvoviolaceus TaxID=285535 RepID=UPI0021BEA51C|nr:hypothetical protein [Streptomyces fulvoviolaceus]MCT9081315.1 hypothetical protein [Streptomyces fulvoviolaceus]
MAARETWRTGPGGRITARALLAGVIGAVVGIAAYAISKTGGQLLSVVVGALAGVAVVLGAHLYRRSAQLTEVQLSLAGNVLTFTANTDMRQAAQRMFFQAATRVATRPLEDGTGNLRKALTSLKTLFDLYREPVESGTAPPPPLKGDSVYEIVLDVLNFELAPFLSKWHPRLDAWEESEAGAMGEEAWPENAAFREDLRELQQRLREYVLALGRIAGLRNPERHLRRSDWHERHAVADRDIAPGSDVPGQRPSGDGGDSTSSCPPPDGAS